MSDELILQNLDGALLTLTINRPEKANSITREMLAMLGEAFQDAAGNGDVRAVVLTGAGDRVFCAGADLNTLYENVEGPDLWKEVPELLRKIPVLTIAAINGPCMGGGLSLALSCDIRVAVPEAKFAYPVLKNNVLPTQYDVDKLCNLIGHGQASSILLGGETITSDKAANWGLIDRQSDRSYLDESCRALAATALVSDVAHLAKLKSMLKGSSE